MAGKGVPKKNAEGYNDPTPYEAMQRAARASINGKRSRVAGEAFERYIQAACDWYRENGAADIEKTPEPMKPLRPPNSKGQFLACFTKQAQPDFSGTLNGGRAIKFEAKHTDDDRIQRSRLSDEQMGELERHHRMGAVAFILVSFSLQQFTRIPWPVWRDMADAYGRKYITREEAKKYAVPCVAGTIKLLDRIAGAAGKSAGPVVFDESWQPKEEKQNDERGITEQR